LLEESKGLSGRAAFFPLNAYTPLLLLSALATVASILFMQRIRPRPMRHLWPVWNALR